MTDDLIRPLRGAYPGPAIEPDSSVRDQLALLGKVGVRYGGLNNATASSLLTDLAAYWKLDTLAWADSVGSNSLTNNGSVTVGMPKVGAGSAEFDGSEQSLSLASTSAVALDGTTSFTLAGWFRTSSAAFQTVIGKETNTSNSEYLLFFQSGTTLGWRVGNNSGSVSQSGLSTGSWHFFVAQYDKASGNIGLSVNNGTFATTSATPVAIINDFNIGSVYTGALFYTGLIDEVGIWKRLLTSGEISSLYNGGSGLSYPFS